MRQPIGLTLASLVLSLIACGDNHPASATDAVCGDGFLDGAEECDDGNLVNSDGCNADCTPSRCGDGFLDFNEGCDDGNRTDGDGCDNNCVQTFCGNGIKSDGEGCDDGNTTSGDGCDNNCTLTACGNGVMTLGETCDDGNATEGDGCDSNCTASACGNGIVGGLEQCDDSNTSSADGCSGTCLTETSEVEPNEDGTPSTGGSGITGNDFAIANADTNGAFTGSASIVAALMPAGDEDVFKLTNTGAAAVRVRLDTWNLATGFGSGVPCGTASIDTGINVRDAAGVVLASNNDRDASTDWCAGLATGLLPGETVYAHVTEAGDNAVVASYGLDITYIPVVCGDGDVGPGEQCDDMNTSAGDGCSMTCQIEGAMAEVEPNEDGTPSTGGSGITGNDFGSANPDANGAITGSTTFIASITPAGDEDVFAFTNTGTTAATVQLDVWNLESGFGIGVPCGTSIDTGMHVRDATGTSLASNDDRNGATDRCSTLDVPLLPGQTRYAHVSEYGDNAVIALYALQIVYTPVVCGDNMVGPGEQCDDGNTADGDGCDATCQIEPICGDNILQPTEQCDDGNTVDNDGCSMTCQLEGAVTEVEPNEDGSISTGGSGTAGNDFGIANPDLNGAFTTSVTIAARIDPAGDEDIFKFTNPLATTAVVKFDVWNLAPGYGIGTPCGTAIDTGMQIKNAAGTSLASNDDRNGSTDRCSSLSFDLAAGQTIYAQVVEYGDNAVIPSYALQVVYTPVVCGDGMIGPGEQCDDTNMMSGDGCSYPTCQIEAFCSDSVIGPGENCDDGNMDDGDGCSATCRVEGEIVEVEPNGTAAEATASTVQLSGDSFVAGSIDVVGDKDVFQFTLATATTVRLETFTSLGECNATTTLDLRLLDGAGTQILADTSSLGIRSCGAIVIFLAAGTYFAQVEERGNNATVPEYLLEVAYQDDRGTETEPNETNLEASANLMALNDVYVFGDHTVQTDADVYAITVPAGARIRAEVVEGDRATETCESNGVDSRLTLYDENFVQLVDDDDEGRGFCSMIDGTGSAPLDASARNATATAQTYFLQVRASTFAQTTAAGQFTYRLQVTIR